MTLRLVMTATLKDTAVVKKAEKPRFYMTYRTPEVLEKLVVNFNMTPECLIGRAKEVVPKARD